jgi:hypothetical protein
MPNDDDPPRKCDKPRPIGPVTVAKNAAGWEAHKRRLRARRRVARPRLRRSHSSAPRQPKPGELPTKSVIASGAVRAGSSLPSWTTRLIGAAIHPTVGHRQITAATSASIVPNVARSARRPGRDDPPATSKLGRGRPPTRVYGRQDALRRVTLPSVAPLCRGHHQP